MVLIAAIDGDEAVATAGRLALADWMGAYEQGQVVERLFERGEFAALLPMLGAGKLGDGVYGAVLERLAGLPGAQLERALAPYLASPGRCDPSSLQGLMRVLVRSGDPGAAAVAAMACAQDADPVVRGGRGRARALASRSRAPISRPATRATWMRARRR